MPSPHFNYISDKIASAKREADNLSSGMQHRGLEGQIREIAAKKCLEPFLTQSFQCGTGKVIDSYQAISDQIDLILFHKKLVPPILVNRELGLYPVECVRYVFEVKTKLTAAEIRDANKKFRSVSALNSFPRKQADGSIQCGGLPVTVLLAFGSDIKGSETDRFMKYTDAHSPCTVLCVLGKGYWVHDYSSNTWHGYESRPDDPPFTEFCLFITGLMNTLSAEETTIRPFIPGIYVDADAYLPPSNQHLNKA